MTKSGTTTEEETKQTSEDEDTGNNSNLFMKDDKKVTEPLKSGFTPTGFKPSVDFSSLSAASGASTSFINPNTKKRSISELEEGATESPLALIREQRGQSTQTRRV